MNSLERHKLALDMKEADRVPVAPSFLTRAVRKAGVCQYDYHTNPEILAYTQINHCEAYDFDGLFISSDNVIMYEALGGKIIFKDKNSYPFWTCPLVTNSKDLSKLKIPDPVKDGRMGIIIEAAHIAMEKVGHQRFVLANIDSGPFALATVIMGMEQAMVFLLEKPEEMKKILEFCSHVTITYGRSMAISGCHGLQFGESPVSLIGRRMYEEIVWPYDCEVITQLKKSECSIFLHICGDTRNIFDLLVKSGADCLEIDSQVDMAWAKKEAHYQVALKGNIDTTSFISKSADEILEEVRYIIESAKMGGGFILAGGCEVPANTAGVRYQPILQRP